MAKKKQPNRWQRLLRVHREHAAGPWLTSLQQQLALGTTTISKVRSECRANGYRWLIRKDANGWNEWRPVRQRIALGSPSPWASRPSGPSPHHSTAWWSCTPVTPPAIEVAKRAYGWPSTTARTAARSARFCTSSTITPGRLKIVRAGNTST